MTGEICVARAARQGPLRPAVGGPASAARATPGWHRTGDVGHLDAEGRLWVEGRLVHVIDDGRRAGDPGRDRAAGRGGRRGRRRRRSSGSGRRARSRSWSSSCAEPGIAARRPGAPLLAVAPLTDAVRAARGRAGRGGAGRRRPARRHPARVQDRPHPGRGVGGAGCWRASGRGGGRDPLVHTAAAPVHTPARPVHTPSAPAHIAPRSCTPQPLVHMPAVCTERGSGVRRRGTGRPRHGGPRRAP